MFTYRNQQSRKLKHELIIQIDQNISDAFLHRANLCISEENQFIILVKTNSVSSILFLPFLHDKTKACIYMGVHL